MGRSTFTQKTDKNQVAKQLQGFAAMLGLSGITVSYHVSAGGLYRLDGDDEGSFFTTTANDVTARILMIAREKKYVSIFKKDIGKQA